ADSIDEGSILEYCGLIMAAVSFPEVQQYLQNGTDIIYSNEKTGDRSEEDVDGSVDDRLFYIQKLCWRALGLQPGHAMDQLKCLLSGENDKTNYFVNNTKVMETLTKYTSVMTVAATNAAMYNIGDSGNQNNDDGTTRVVSVAYSEKIVSVPNNVDGNNITSRSLSAPTSNTIDEHKLSQQRQDMDVAHKTTMLQNQLWTDFQSLSHHEQSKTLEKAKNAHLDLMEKVANTPPGMDRVLLMQSIDGEVQKLLVIYKMWCSQYSGAE
ncbi:hypothetical protein ACHAXR_003181, partial [Thalassiosira sp. AJA248-18]